MVMHGNGKLTKGEGGSQADAPNMVILLPHFGFV